MTINDFIPYLLSGDMEIAYTYDYCIYCHIESSCNECYAGFDSTECTIIRLIQSDSIITLKLDYPELFL